MAAAAWHLLHPAAAGPHAAAGVAGADSAQLCQRTPGESVDSGCTGVPLCVPRALSCNTTRFSRTSLSVLTANHVTPNPETYSNEPRPRPTKPASSSQPNRAMSSLSLSPGAWTRCLQSPAHKHPSSSSCPQVCSPTTVAVCESWQVCTMLLASAFNGSSANTHA